MKVSVIIPTYNREKYIGRCIRSLLNQNWSKDNYEIVVINDGSNDRTFDILKSFGDAIQIINLSENKGLPYACNKGIVESKGFFIVRVDDDDYVNEEFLKTLYNFLTINKDFDAVSCDYLIVDEKENVLAKKNSEEDPIACGIMFKKDNLISIGLYDENFLSREDEDLRIRYTKKYNIFRIALPLYRYMMHNNNMTNDENKMKNFKAILDNKYNRRKEIKILDRVISDKNAPFVIAEIGVNYYEIAKKESLGLLDAAKKMVTEAAKAGADAVKFQIYKAEKLASIYSPAYWDTTKETTKSQYELFKKYDQLTDEDYKQLAEYSKKEGVIFLATPFDDNAVELVDKLCPAFKIASADITHFPLLKSIAKKGKPIILSVGASSKEEIQEAIELIKSEGNNQIALLHCVLNYPTAYSNANLKRIEYLNKEFPECIIGYSDHTLPDSNMAVITTAVVLGANIIEKHFTLDKLIPGNDHYHSMDQNDLKKIKEILNIYKEAVSANPENNTNEDNSIKYARRSIVARNDLLEDTVISLENILIKRPGTGISPKFIDQIIGKKINRNIKKDELINWEDLN